MKRSIQQLQQYGTTALIASTIVVGASIAIDGQIGRLLNGTGGLIWFGAAGVLAIAAKRSDEPVSRWVIALGLTATVAFVAKPTDLLNATLGLGIAGGLIAAAVRDRPVLWASLIPALYLPAHIGTAVLKAVGRNLLGLESSIRSEPPPTAAVVPFVMVAAAVGGGWLVSKWRDRPERASVSLR
ncbi:MAG: hypothetical protein WKF81_12635 [Thermomicrobiales bacterium]